MHCIAKYPGVRPGETICHIVGRAISLILLAYIQDAAGAFQLCACHKCSCEAAVDGMHNIHSGSNAVILVDASNAFNRLNRQITFHNIFVHHLLWEDHFFT